MDAVGSPARGAGATQRSSQVATSPESSEATRGGLGERESRAPDLVVIEPTAFGAFTRTGSVVLIALRRSGGQVGFAGRWEAPLVPASLPGQPYHAAARLAAAAAESLVGRCERAAAVAAVAALRRAAGDLALPVPEYGIAVVVKPVSVPEDVAAVLRSHAWMHAAEGILYREAVLAAARRCGWQAVAVDAAALPAAEPAIGAIGAVAGRPWRRIEKDAARAAITLLQRG